MAQRYIENKWSRVNSHTPGAATPGRAGTNTPAWRERIARGFAGYLYHLLGAYICLMAKRSSVQSWIRVVACAKPCLSFQATLPQSSHHALFASAISSHCARALPSAGQGPLRLEAFHRVTQGTRDAAEATCICCDECSSCVCACPLIKIFYMSYCTRVLSVSAFQQLYAAVHQHSAGLQQPWARDLGAFCISSCNGDDCRPAHPLMVTVL